MAKRTRRLILQLFLLGLWGCGSGTPPSAPTPAPSAPQAPRVDAAAKAAELYTTTPTPRPVRGDARTEEHGRALLELARARGMKLEGDGRLADLAGWVASSVDERGKPPAIEAIDFHVRHLGLVEPVPFIMWTNRGVEDAWEKEVAALLAGAPSNIPYNRYGMATVTRGGDRLTVVALSACRADLEPIRRRVPEGSTLRVRGRLHDGYRDARVVVTSPAGEATPVVQGAGSAIEASLVLAARGTHRVELSALGPSGIETLARVPVLVGDPEARAAQRSTEADLACQGCGRHPW